MWNRWLIWASTWAVLKISHITLTEKSRSAENIKKRGTGADGWESKGVSQSACPGSVVSVQGVRHWYSCWTDLKCFWGDNKHMRIKPIYWLMPYKPLVWLCNSSWFIWSWTRLNYDSVGLPTMSLLVLCTFFNTSTVAFLISIVYFIYLGNINCFTIIYCRNVLFIYM